MNRSREAGKELRPKAGSGLVLAGSWLWVGFGLVQGGSWFGVGSGWFMVWGWFRVGVGQGLNPLGDVLSWGF